MTTAYWCVLIAILLPYVFTGYAKGAGPGFNSRTNHTPREFLEQLTGARKRAHWAQLNSFEAVPGFIAAVIIAHQLHVPQASLDHLAVTFIIARLFYGFFYIKDLATLRTLAWMIGMGCIVTLFVKAA